MKTPAASNIARPTKRADSAPLGIARRAVRGLRRSSSASSSRFDAIAAVRAAIMQTTTIASFPTTGPPTRRHAITAASTAHGMAKTVWLILMSPANLAILVVNPGEDDSIATVMGEEARNVHTNKRGI